MGDNCNHSNKATAKFKMAADHFTMVINRSNEIVVQKRKTKIIIGENAMGQVDLEVQSLVLLAVYHHVRVF